MGSLLDHSMGEQTTWQVVIVGGFRVMADGEPVRIPTCAERIVAYLAIATEPVERSQIAGTLYLDKCEERAKANLRSALWRLRKTAPELIDDHGSRLAIAVEVDVDLRSFHEWADDLGRDRRRATDDRSLDPGRLHARPELLPGWYDDWVVMARERFRQRALHAGDRLIDQLIGQGRHGDAIDACYVMIDIEPFREASHRNLVRAHLAEGNRNEAIRHVNRVAATFRDELDIEIGSTFDDLIDAHLPFRCGSGCAEAPLAGHRAADTSADRALSVTSRGGSSSG